jgi:hypothetical protein
MSVKEENWWALVKMRSTFFLTIIVCILLDSLFVIIWGGLHQLFHIAIDWLKLWLHATKITEYLILVVKAFFDLVTLAIVVVFIYADFKRIVGMILEMATHSTKGISEDSKGSVGQLDEGDVDSIVGVDDAINVPNPKTERVQ